MQTAVNKRFKPATSSKPTVVKPTVITPFDRVPDVILKCIFDFLEAVLGCLVNEKRVIILSSIIYVSKQWNRIGTAWITYKAPSIVLQPSPKLTLANMNCDALEAFWKKRDHANSKLITANREPYDVRSIHVRSICPYGTHAGGCGRCNVDADFEPSCVDSMFAALCSDYMTYNVYNVRFDSTCIALSTEIQVIMKDHLFFEHSNIQQLHMPCDFDILHIIRRRIPEYKSIMMRAETIVYNDRSVQLCTHCNTQTYETSVCSPGCPYSHHKESIDARVKCGMCMAYSRCLV